MKKRKDGRYQKKVTLSDGRQKLVYGRTIAEVNRAADELRDQDRQGLIVGDTTTVGEWAKTWFVTYKTGLRENTLSGYRNAYNKHILPYLAVMHLKDVRPVHVRQVMQEVAGMSEDLQRKVLNTMRQIFSTARQNGLMVNDPADGIKITPHAKPPKKEYLSRDEQSVLMDSITDPQAKCFAGLCLYCGLRREEALGLQWGDIDGDRLTVNRASTFLHNNQPDPVQELKSKASHRTIPIPSIMAAILEETPRFGLYIIARENGAPLSQMTYRRLWSRVKAGVDFDVHAHQLRHSYCSNLYRAGIDLKTAQYLMGHSTIQMTANVYTHLEKENANASIVQLEKYLSGGSQEGEIFGKVVKK